MELSELGTPETRETLGPKQARWAASINLTHAPDFLHSSRWTRNCESSKPDEEVDLPSSE